VPVERATPPVRAEPSPARSRSAEKRLPAEREPAPDAPRGLPDAPSRRGLPAPVPEGEFREPVPDGLAAPPLREEGRPAEAEGRRSFGIGIPAYERSRPNTTSAAPLCAHDLDLERSPKMTNAPTQKGLRRWCRNPAATYSPRGSTPKYHRRRQS
jgi:hypothetical protein